MKKLIKNTQVGIINFSIVVTDKLYKLPNIYNKKLVIYIYIDNDTIIFLLNTKRQHGGFETMTVGF